MRASNYRFLLQFHEDERRFVLGCDGQLELVLMGVKGRLSCHLSSGSPPACIWGGSNLVSEAPCPGMSCRCEMTALSTVTNKFQGDGPYSLRCPLPKRGCIERTVTSRRRFMTENWVEVRVLRESTSWHPSPGTFPPRTINIHYSPVTHRKAGERCNVCLSQIQGS